MHSWGGGTSLVGRNEHATLRPPSAARLELRVRTCGPIRLDSVARAVIFVVVRVRVCAFRPCLHLSLFVCVSWLPVLWPEASGTREGHNACKQYEYGSWITSGLHID